MQVGGGERQMGKEGRRVAGGKLSQVHVATSHISSRASLWAKTMIKRAKTLVGHCFSCVLSGVIAVPDTYRFLSRSTNSPLPPPFHPLFPLLRAPSRNG